MLKKRLSDEGRSTNTLPSEGLQNEIHLLLSHG
jgi:hypothetical protein